MINWNLLLQVSVFLLPLLAPLGVIGLLFVLFATWIQKFSQLWQYPLNKGIVLLCFWLIITSIVSINPIEAFLGTTNIIPFLLLQAAIGYRVRTVTALSSLAWSVVLPSSLIVILGLGQLYLGWSSEQMPGVLGLRIAGGGQPLGRMSAIFMYANILAAYLLITATLGLGLWIETYQQWRRKSQPIIMWRLIGLSVILLLNIIGLILTDSRNVWGLMVLVSLIYAVYLGWYYIVAGVVSAATAISWAAWGPSWGKTELRQVVPSYIWARLSDELYPDRPVATLRKTQWGFAWQLFLEHPWTGWGLRSFSILYKNAMGLWLGHPHNLFLMFLAETGLIGTLLISGLVGWVLFHVCLLIRNALSAKEEKTALILFSYLLSFTALTLFNTFDVTIFDFRVNMLGWVLLSYLTGVVLKADSSSNSP